MQNEIILNELKEKIEEYADNRLKDVKRGAETPHLAALIVQKYGYGLADAANVYQNNGIRIDTQSLYDAVDEAVEKIDPDWQKHAVERWAGEPADIVSSFNRSNELLKKQRI